MICSLFLLQNHNNNQKPDSDLFRKLKETSLTEFQTLIISSRNDTQLAALLYKKLNLEPSFIEGALRRAVTISKVDLLKHALELNKLLPHDSSMKISDEMLLQQIQRAVNLHEIDTLRCLLSFLSNSRALTNKCHLQNLAILSAHLGFADAVEVLCERFPVCLEQTSQGHCLTLTLARYCDQQSFELLREFLSRGVSANMQEPSGDTALHVAVRERNMKAVQLLLEYRASTEIPNILNQTPLGVCDETELLLLLRGAESLSPLSVSLYLAAINNNREIVQQMLNSGIDVDSKWIKGRTALSAVAINGDIELAEMLLQNGAQPFPMGNYWPETPAAHALAHKKFAVAKRLLEKTEEMYMQINDAERKHVYAQLVYLLHNCAQVGAVEVGRLILDSRYGIDADYEVLNTVLPIHVACRYGQLEFIKLLLEYGVNPNSGTQIYDNSPLHYACFYGNINVARHLLTLPGVELNQQNRQLETPLYCVLRGQLSSREKGRIQESAIIFLLMMGAKLYKPGRNNCELALFDLQFAALRWDFVPFHTQKLIMVVRDVAKPCSLCNLARFAVRSAIQVPLNETSIDATGLSYRMQNYVLLKDWFPTF